MEEEEEELEKAAVVPKPAMPDRATVERHNAAGRPQFRSWCDHCVRGKAVNKPNKGPQMLCVDDMTMKTREEKERERGKG